MDQPVALHRRIARPGASLTEYGILIGLVAIVGYAGVQMLGSSSSSSLMGSAQGLEENGTLNLIRPKHAKAAAVAEPPSFLASMMPALLPTPEPQPAPEAFAPEHSAASLTQSEAKTQADAVLEKDAATAEPVLKVGGVAIGVATSVSSIEGNTDTHKVFQTVAFAQSLTELAAKEPEPAVKSYLQTMANLAYSIGGVEGAVVEVPGLKPRDGKTYSDTAMARDLNSFQDAMEIQLKNPPAAMSEQTIKEIRQYGNTCINAAETFIADNFQQTGSKQYTTGTKGTAPSYYSDTLGGNLDTVKRVANQLVANQLAAPKTVTDTLGTAVVIEATEPVNESVQINVKTGAQLE